MMMVQDMHMYLSTGLELSAQHWFMLHVQHLVYFAFQCQFIRLLLYLLELVAKSLKNMQLQYQALVMMRLKPSQHNGLDMDTDNLKGLISKMDSKLIEGSN